MRSLVAAMACTMLLVSSARAQFPATYDVRWMVVCGPNAFNLDQNVASLHSGQLQVSVTQHTDPATGSISWSGQDTSTGEIVLPFLSADGGGAQDVRLPGIDCATSLFGGFEWNPAVNEDRFKTFAISDAEPFSSRQSARAYVVAMRTTPPPPPPTGPAVTLTLTSGQVVSGALGVDMSVAGLGAGPYKWVVTVDGREIVAFTTFTTSTTLSWNTKNHVNGGHTYYVRVTDTAAKLATGKASVTVRN